MGKVMVTGPSIRLAEAIAQNWGNVDCGIREIEQAHGSSTMEAYAIDLETNYRVSKVFSVAHVRYTKSSGSRRLEDPRDIYEATANQGARRLRACILSVVPGDVIEAAVKQCEKTLNACADVGTEAVKKMLAAFAQYGVSSQHIEARIQRRLDAIQPAQMVSLKKIYASLRDGMSGPSDWFTITVNGAESTKKGSRTEGLKEKLRDRAPPTQEPEVTKPAPGDTGEARVEEI